MNGSIKVALVTGGTHGIGKATAQALAAGGWIVYICGSNPDDNSGHLMERGNANLYYRLADITQDDAVATLVNEIAQKHGKLDLAFNNAGIGCTPKLPHMTNLIDFERVIRTNLMGTVICMKHEINVMLNQASPGIIINNSSISAMKGKTGADSSYAASKAGVIALTREAAVVEEYRDKIIFYSVMPGYVETRMTALDDKTAWAERLPGGKVVKPGDVADLVLRIAEKPMFASGQAFYMDGGNFLI